jgi:hypothetical protein
VQTLLDTTLQTALCVRGAGANASLVVLVDNVASGHEWPSGAAQDRRAWFEVAAFAQGAELYHSGNVQPRRRSRRPSAQRPRAETESQ